MSSKKSLGRFGEQIAVQYLKEQDYRIIEQNYYSRWGEIDLICEKDGVTVFVEVKTRTNTEFGYPEESLTKKKIKSLVRACQRYMIGKVGDWQIDVLAITLTENAGAQIHHLKNSIGQN